MNIYKKIFNYKPARKKPKNPSYGQEGYSKGNKGVSNLEKELYEFVKSKYSGKIINSNRTILRSRELDIFIPELKLAIEFNGDYWHSIKHKQYWEHSHKTKNCEGQGIRLIQVWESEWKNNRPYVEYVIECYLNGEIPKIDSELLNRDYFSKLDFPTAEEIKPTITKSGNQDVIKSGFLKLKEQ